MPLVVNGHVTRLSRYQPFDADSADAIFETQAGYDQPMFPVVTRRILSELVRDSAVRMVVLTGDAGHGKTSLCAALLEELGHSPVEAAQAIKESGKEANTPAAHTDSGRPIYILKDLSDFTSNKGAQFLEKLMHPPNSGIAIVCANEGQLRACVSQDQSGRTQSIVDTLATGLYSGAVTSADRDICVINLNFQSVAPTRAGGGLVDWATKIWGADKRSWRACKACDARAACPIIANHYELSAPAKGDLRRAAMRDLFAAAERAGAVITARQVLANIALSITGGLKCDDVHSRFEKSPNDVSWQFEYLYHQAIFGDRLLQQQRDQVPSIAALRKLDPGQVSRRKVDDYLDYENTDTNFMPALPAHDQVRTARDALKYNTDIKLLYTFLRRLDYFNGAADSRFERLGLSSGHAFVGIDSSKSDSEKANIRDLLLKGLEAIQGIHRLGRNPDFLVLDPAFFSHRAKAAVVGRSVTSRNIRIEDQLTHWTQNAGDSSPSYRLDEVVEWLNRSIFIEMPGTGSGMIAIQIDLYLFELLSRWAGGLRSGTHHEAQIRGLTSVLAEVADAADKREVIQVLVGSSTRQLTIDVGDQIRSVR